LIDSNFRSHGATNNVDDIEMKELRPQKSYALEVDYYNMNSKTSGKQP